jgi:hypothetical protein
MCGVAKWSKQLGIGGWVTPSQNFDGVGVGPPCLDQFKGFFSIPNHYLVFSLSLGVQKHNLVV